MTTMIAICITPCIATAKKYRCIQALILPRSGSTLFNSRQTSGRTRIRRARLACIWLGRSSAGARHADDNPRTGLFDSRQRAQDANLRLEKRPRVNFFGIKSPIWRLDRLLPCGHDQQPAAARTPAAPILYRGPTGPCGQDQPIGGREGIGAVAAGAGAGQGHPGRYSPLGRCRLRESDFKRTPGNARATRRRVCRRRQATPESANWHLTVWSKN
jgi:hypothetical protein